MQSALKPRCIGCSNCVLACPFGVPKYVAEFDQMMKCDMCTDRTSEGYARCARRCARARRSGTARSRSSTPPARGSLLDDFLFGRQEVRTKVYTVVDDLGGPLDVLAGTTAPGSTTRSAWRTDGPTTTRPVDRADLEARLPVRGAAEEEVTRREFARYLVLGAGAMAAGNVGLAAWTQLRTINTGEPRADRRARRRRGRRHVPVPLSRPTTTRRSSLRLADARSSRSARSAPTSAASSTTSPTRSAGTARATRATSTPAPAPCISGPPTAAARPHRRRGPRRRHDLGARATEREDVRARGRRTSSAVVALRHHPRRVPGVPDHRRRRGVPDRRRVARLGDRRRLGRRSPAAPPFLLRYLRP